MAERKKTTQSAQLNDHANLSLINLGVVSA